LSYARPQAVARSSRPSCQHFPWAPIESSSRRSSIGRRDRRLSRSDCRAASFRRGNMTPVMSRGTSPHRVSDDDLDPPPYTPIQAVRDPANRLSAFPAQEARDSAADDSTVRSDVSPAFSFPSELCFLVGTARIGTHGEPKRLDHACNERPGCGAPGEAKRDPVLKTSPHVECVEPTEVQRPSGACRIDVEGTCDSICREPM